LLDKGRDLGNSLRYVELLQDFVNCQVTDQAVDVQTDHVTLGQQGSDVVRQVVFFVEENAESAGQIDQAR